MKTAVVIGGSNGIGLAITSLLINRGYYVKVLDRNSGDLRLFDEKQYDYSYCDLLDFDEDLITSLANDKDIEVLMITAGFGRVADFQYHHIAEIENMFRVDTVSTIKIIRLFYDRILNDNSFYTGVMGSIAGWLSSPSASVYSAAKAGVVRLMNR